MKGPATSVVTISFLSVSVNARSLFLRGCLPMSFALFKFLLRSLRSLVTQRKAGIRAIDENLF